MGALRIERVDPQGQTALALLEEAALDARILYPELHPAGSPPATNAPLSDCGAYVVGYLGALPVASGALHPLSDVIAEVKRVYVHREHRRRGYGRAIVARLIEEARALGYALLRLETGHKQDAAMLLYEQMGFRRIPRFGPYVDDPTSICFELEL